MIEHVIIENTQIPNFMNIRPVRAEFFHADRHDEANSHFSQNLAKAA